MSQMRKQILTEASVSLHPDKNKVGNAYFFRASSTLLFRIRTERLKKAAQLVNFS